MIPTGENKPPIITGKPPVALTKVSFDAYHQIGLVFLWNWI